LGLGRLNRLDPKPPAIRYRHERPGGSAYRSHPFRAACAQAGLRHIRTRPPLG
jgi:transposase InsO family protein